MKKRTKRKIKNAISKASVIASMYGCFLGMLYDGFIGEVNNFRPGLMVMVGCMMYLVIWGYAQSYISEEERRKYERRYRRSLDRERKNRTEKAND
jgi:putative Mn2+ efflux pump MntP